MGALLHPLQISIRCNADQKLVIDVFINLEFGVGLEVLLASVLNRPPLGLRVSKLALRQLPGGTRQAEARPVP